MLVGYLVSSHTTAPVHLAVQQLFRVRHLREGDMYLYLQDALHGAKVAHSCNPKGPHGELDWDAMLDRRMSSARQDTGDDGLKPHGRIPAAKGWFRWEEATRGVAKWLMAMCGQSRWHFQSQLVQTLQEDWGIACTVKGAPAPFQSPPR